MTPTNLNYEIVIQIFNFLYCSYGLAIIQYGCKSVNNLRKNLIEANLKRPNIFFSHYLCIIFSEHYSSHPYTIFKWLFRTALNKISSQIITTLSGFQIFGFLPKCTPKTDGIKKGSKRRETKIIFHRWDCTRFFLHVFFTRCVILSRGWKKEHK